MGVGATTLAAISLGVGVIGTGVSAIGAISQGNAQADAARYQSQVAANNAIISQQQAQTTIASGEQQAAIQGMKTRATVGAIKAAQGASNIDVNTGSTVDVRESAAELGMEDTLTTRSNAARQAYGYQVGATSDTAQAGLLQKRASGAETAGAFGAVGSLLGGASSFGKQFSDFKQAGVFGGGTTGGGGYTDDTSTFF